MLLSDYQNLGDKHKEWPIERSGEHDPGKEKKAV